MTRLFRAFLALSVLFASPIAAQMSFTNPGSTGSGSGTVTSVGVTTANGVSGTVANPTTTPAITVSLGAITPSSVASTGTVTGTNLSGTHSGSSSGTNTGDQTITLTGPVTGTGTGSFATTITSAAVTYSKIQNVAATSLLGNPTGSPAAPSEITLGNGLSFSGTTLNSPQIVQCQSAVAVPHTGDTAEFTAATCTIPANALGANGRLQVMAEWSWPNNANTKTVRIRFGGTLYMAAAVTTTVQGNFLVAIANRNSASSQVGTNQVGQIAGANGNAVITSALNTTSAQDITITEQLGTGTDTMTLESYQVLIWPKP